MKANIRGKFIIFVILIFMFCILPSGCARDKSELREIAAVMGIGVDRISGDEPVLVTLEIIGSKRGEGEEDTSMKESGSIIKMSKGKTFFHAIKNFSRESPAILDFSHVKTIILSKNVCKSGISEVLDYVNRERQFRSTNWLLVSEGSAREVLENKIMNEDITSIGIDNIMKKFQKNAYIVPVTINDFIVESESESKTGFIPLAEIKKINGKSRREIKIDRMAVFKDNRLIGELTKEETRSFQWVYENGRGNMVVFPLKLGEENKGVTIEVYKKTSKIIPYKTKDGFRLKIECTGYANLREIQNIDVTTKFIEKIEHNTEIILESEVNRLIQKSQKELNADFVGFSKYIFNNYPSQWHHMKNNWSSIFPNTKYDITFKIDITKIGLIKDTPSGEGEE